MKAAERIARISDIREKALKIISAQGVLGDLGSDASIGGLKMSLRTPFQKLPEVSDEMRRLRVFFGEKGNHPYRLDIWDEHRRVLNVEWDNAGAIEVISYKPGEWEFLLGSS